MAFSKAKGIEEKGKACQSRAGQTTFFIKIDNPVSKWANVSIETNEISGLSEAEEGRAEGESQWAKNIYPGWLLSWEIYGMSGLLRYRQRNERISHKSSEFIGVLFRSTSDSRWNSTRHAGQLFMLPDLREARASRGVLEVSRVSCDLRLPPGRDINGLHPVRAVPVSHHSCPASWQSGSGPARRKYLTWWKSSF